MLVLALTAASASAETLTVAKSPQGVPVGTVTSNPAGISCGSDCTEDYPREELCLPNPHGGETCSDIPQSVTLTAGAGNGFAVDDWTGCNSSDGDECTVSMSADKTVTAHYSDVTDPSVALTAPTSGAKRGSIDLGATASDNWEVAKVEFRVRSVLVATDTTAPYSGTFNTASISDGTATVSATAYDRAARSSFASSTSITIDNTAPSIGITGPDGETFGPGTTQSWTFALADSASGISQVQCSVVESGSSESFGSCSGGSAGHAVSNRPGGDHELSVKVKDAAGHESVATRQFSIDAAPPETTIEEGPANGSSSESTSATFDFASSEPASTYMCRVYPAALTPPAFAACSGETSHTASGFSPGTYAFEVVATDAVGNIDPTPAKRVFTVLAPPPTPDPGAPGGGAGGGGSATTAAGPAGPAGHLPAQGMTIDPKVSKRWAVSGGRTQIRKLALRDVPPGASVQVKCRGKGCPFRSKRIKAGNGSANLTSLFKKSKLRSGATIEIRITAPDGAGKLYRYVTRTGSKRPRSITLCIVPGSSKPKRC